MAKKWINKKVQIYEYTTRNFNKGYFTAKNEKLAFKKVVRLVGKKRLLYYKNKPLISYYGDKYIRTRAK